MKTVQAFIELGFNVVPLLGVITRAKDGKKIIPKFQGAWKELYLDTPYDPKSDGKAVALTGAFITGKRSGAISIDCDDELTYEIFKALDPSYKFVFVSKGKPEGGASIVYRMTEEMEDIPSFRIHGEHMNLDYQTNDLLQFLPTSGNKSKEEWEGDTLDDLPELREPPPIIIAYLRTLHNLHTKSSSITNSNNEVTYNAVDRHYMNLAPFIETFLKTKLFSPELFRILTPNSGGFKDLDQYKADRTLHPNNVPNGKGNEYLTSVAGVLVCDNSVSSKMFKEFMLEINQMWDTPYPTERINTMIKYQLNRDKWTYDENWTENVSVILTEYNTIVKVFYDPLTRVYYSMDNKFGMSIFNSVDLLPKHLNSIVQGGRRYRTADVYDYLEKKQTVMSAIEEFGDLPPKDLSTGLNRYNLFQRSKSYDILLNPDKYEEEFKGKVPEATIKFFEHLIPDEETREYVIRFVLTKLLTLKFSEVVLYFLGKQGAGKNLFIDWLDKFTENSATNSSSADYRLVVEVDLENFLAKYNLWIINALFANLDEYGEKTMNANEDKRVLAQLKSYTGKQTIQLRTMHSDPVPADHHCTFILTANRNRLSPDLEDRRLVMIETPDQLDRSDFVIRRGGKSEAIEEIFEEQHLWAYWWRKHYKVLPDDQYRTPPATKFKRDMILRHLPPSKKIVSTIISQDAKSMISMCEDFDLMEELIADVKYGAVSKTLLVDLFCAMTEGTMARKSMLDTTIRDEKLIPVKMRFGSKKSSVYGFPFLTLKLWASKLQMNDGVLLSTEE